VLTLRVFKTQEADALTVPGSLLETPGHTLASFFSFFRILEDTWWSASLTYEELRRNLIVSPEWPPASSDLAFFFFSLSFCLGSGVLTQRLVISQ
jgi:hypothetical protein